MFRFFFGSWDGSINLSTVPKSEYSGWICLTMHLHISSIRGYSSQNDASSFKDHLALESNWDGFFHFPDWFLLGKDMLEHLRIFNYRYLRVIVYSCIRDGFYRFQGEYTYCYQGNSRCTFSNIRCIFKNDMQVTYRIQAIGNKTFLLVKMIVFRIFTVLRVWVPEFNWMLYAY